MQHRLFFRVPVQLRMKKLFQFSLSSRWRVSCAFYFARTLCILDLYLDFNGHNSNMILICAVLAASIPHHISWYFFPVAMRWNRARASQLSLICYGLSALVWQSNGNAQMQGMNYGPLLMTVQANGYSAV